MQNLEQRMQQYREMLKIEFAPKEKKRFALFADDTKYISTWDIAKTIQGSRNSNQLEIRGSSLLLLGIFLIVAPIVGFISTYKEENYISWIFFPIFLILGIKILYDSARPKVKLLLDEKGLFFYEWTGYIEWENIVSTYIKENQDDENQTKYLLLFYYNKEINDFLRIEILLNNLKTSAEEISYFIEELKSKAGFPTQPGFY